MRTSHGCLANARRLLAAGAALAVVSAAAPSYADDLPDSKFMRYLMRGMGLVGPDDQGIEYRERSPLVVPPNTTLPPPETTPLTKQYPNWPTEPEVREARKRAEAEKKRGAIPDWERDNPIMPSELEKGRTARRGAGPESPPAYETRNAVKPSALGYVGNMFSSMFEKDKPEAKVFTREPSRSALTDPPPGYQTPSSAYAYGVGKQGPAPLPNADPYDYGTPQR